MSKAKIINWMIGNKPTRKCNTLKLFAMQTDQATVHYANSYLWEYLQCTTRPCSLPSEFNSAFLTKQYTSVGFSESPVDLSSNSYSQKHQVVVITPLGSVNGRLRHLLFSIPLWLCIIFYHWLKPLSHAHRGRKGTEHSSKMRACAQPHAIL